MESIQLSEPTFEHHTTGFGIGHATPRISWQFRTNDVIFNWIQKGYDIEITSLPTPTPSPRQISLWLPRTRPLATLACRALLAKRRPSSKQLDRRRSPRLPVLQAQYRPSVPCWDPSQRRPRPRYSAAAARPTDLRPSETSAARRNPSVAVLLARASVVA